MEDRIVSFETAKLAREKRFYIDCDKIYNYLGELWKAHYMTANNDDIESGMSCTAPTQSLLQKWLREKHNIMVYLVRYDDGIYPPRWSVYIYFDKIKTLDKSKHHYICGNDDYENGLEIGLFEALKLIQNEKDNN